MWTTPSLWKSDEPNWPQVKDANLGFVTLCLFVINQFSWTANLAGSNQTDLKHHHTDGDNHWFEANTKICTYAKNTTYIPQTLQMSLYCSHWLIDCFGFNGLWDSSSVYIGPSPRGEMIDERKNVQTTPTRTYCKHSRPFPYNVPNK